ncbi:MAG: TonB family protein [Ignavibacteriales bacterium]|nr:TonB family protein [Ignavibacteriales bacterium]
MISIIKKLFLLIIFLISNISAQNGTVKTYHMSGKVESRIAFVDDILEGTSYWYYENGNIRTEKNYSNGKLNGLTKNFYPTGLLKDEIRYSDGMLHGVSRRFYENGALAEVKNYEFGELKSVKNIEFDKDYIAPLSAYEEGKRKKNVENDDFICSAQICPEPVGGIEEIESNIIYPKLARQYKLEGSVLITTTINKRGISENIKVLQGLGLGCSEAAIEAVKNTKFIPGENNGEIVETEVTFKLNFRIKEAEDKPTIIASEKSELTSESKIDSSKQKDFIICDVDECPEPIGGITELIKKINYPPHAKRNNISGEVILNVKVDDIGFVISTEVKQGLGYGCDEAAKSAVIKTEFMPAKQNGKNVESNIEITVPFILDDKK